jgi:3-dehydroquinate synthase
MNEIVLRAERDYSVDFEIDWKSSLTGVIGSGKACVLIPKKLVEIVGSLPSDWLVIELPDGESQKSGAVYLQILERLAEERFGRDSFLVGVGGGATTDLAGFVAATYMRGLQWVAVPTSLAGMVDAAIGGKTGINLVGGKNLAGAFHSPSKVIVDEIFLSTLSERDLKAGLAEVAKCGFIADSEILSIIARGWRENLSELIKRAITVKARVVSSDFRESFEREILNYGHTLGHAIERHSDYKLRHGECVSIGLIYAAHISAHFSGLTTSGVQLHKSTLEALDLPITYSSSAWKELLELMLRDKKSRSSLRFVTLSEIGKPTRAENPDIKILQDIYESEMGR